MNRRDYEKTTDYQKSVQMIREFVDDVLDGDIENLRSVCFEDFEGESKYVGDVVDPDMYRISQAIYIVLWGDLFDLAFENMGSWNPENTFAFRGDTMNSFGSLIGRENKKEGREFAFRACFYDADKNSELWVKIQKFYKMYHNIGNFIILPNRGNCENGINGIKGEYWFIREYFDWFMLKVFEYQKRIKQGAKSLTRFENQLHMNPEYAPNFMEIKEWKERFFLEPYFRGDEPELLFQTPLQDRLKITSATDSGKKYYGKEEYLSLLEDYIDKSMDVITYRADRMIGVLKELFMQNTR